MNLLRVIDVVFPPKIAYAHCDVPCGIYETNTLLVAAHTVGRMVEVVNLLPAEKSTKDKNTFFRCVRVKEEHAQICKEQLMVLWADFFKPEHLEKFPDLHDKVWKALKLCSECKQNVDVKLAADLMVACREIAEMFDQVKVEPKESLSGSVSDNPDAPKKKLLGA